MRTIQKFVCDMCRKEYYDSITAEKCELMHTECLVLGSYLTHVGKVALSVQVAVEHVVNCDWCKDDIKTTQGVEKRDFALQRARLVLSHYDG